VGTDERGIREPDLKKLWADKEAGNTTVIQKQEKYYLARVREGLKGIREKDGLFLPIKKRMWVSGELGLGLGPCGLQAQSGGR